MITPTNITKSAVTYVNAGKTFRAVYGVARYGISIYGSASLGDGVFSNTTKSAVSYANVAKS